MANSNDFQGGALIDNHGTQSSELQCNRRHHGNSRKKHLDVDIDTSLPSDNSCFENIKLPPRLDLESDDSKVEQLTRDLSKVQEKKNKWKGKARKFEGKLKGKKKFTVLRQACSDFIETPEGKHVDKHLMKKTCGKFPDAFRPEYCKSYKWEVNIQMFLSINRENFLTDPEAVEKRLSRLCFKRGNVNKVEVMWRMSKFDDSDVALSNLKSAASELVLEEEEKRELKLRWDKPKLEKYFLLCKAAAIGNEEAHCVVDSPELNVNGLGDSGELTFEDENLGDFVKDIIKLGNSDDHHKHPDRPLRASPPHPPARPLQAGPRWGGPGPRAGMPGAMPSASRGEPHCTANPATEWPPLNGNADLQGPALPLQRSGGWRAALLAPPPRSNRPTGLGRGGPLHLPATRGTR